MLERVKAKVLPSQPPIAKRRASTMTRKKRKRVREARKRNRR
jgi:hypothetical protein